MSTRVADLALLSDCQSAALVDRAGTVAWWSTPRFDSAPCLGRLLDPEAGHLTVAPTAPAEVSRCYRPGTLVLETTFVTDGGRLRVTDALAFAPGARGHDIGLGSPHVLARDVACLDGEVDVELDFVPRPDFGLVRPRLAATADGLRTIGGPDVLALDTDAPLELDGDRARARWRLRAGERTSVVVRHAVAADGEPAPAPGAAAIVADTAAGWESWSGQHDAYSGDYPDAVRHSAAVIQGLTYAPTGALIAAATTSLPEVPGGEANWDYRYAWLRDASFDVTALQVGACGHEVRRYLEWILDAVATSGLGALPQVAFAVDGRRDLGERELDHLAGFDGARPVRVGNAAWHQRQLDVPGEVLDAVWRAIEHGGAEPPGEPEAAVLCGLADAAAREWRHDDSGIWEGREGQRPYTTSKVLAWAALDRAVRLAPHLGPCASPQRWATERDAIRRTVLDEAWDAGVGAYTGALGSDHLDAGVLLMPLVGFTSMDDPRMRATVATIEEQLADGPIVRRWTGSDEEGGFAVCSFWLAECHALAGDEARAREIFEAAAGRANDVGLFTELFDGDGGLRGNIPQSFVHAALVCTAAAIDRLSASGRAS